MDKEATKIIKIFLKKLRKKFSVEKIFLFGSRAGKDYLKHSDIDLIIISKDFEGINFVKRMSLMYDYWDFDYAVDFLCYTPEEFNKLSKMISIVREASKKGIVFS